LEVQIGKSGVINSKLHGFDELFESSKAPIIESVVYIPAERADTMRTLRQLLRLFVATSYLGAPPHERKVIQLMRRGSAFPVLAGSFLTSS